MEIITNKMGRVRPVPEGEHDAGRDYRMLSIVYSNQTNKSYISKQDVPVGINIDNKTYWQVFGNGKFVDNAIINVSYLENSIIAHTLAEAISMVAEEDRRPGILLAFYEAVVEVNEPNRWNIYQFKGSSVDDWNKQEYWYQVYQNGSAFKGWFYNSTDLVHQYPIPHNGDFAYIGQTLEESVIWKCNVDGTWINSNEEVKKGIQVIISGNITVSSNNTWVVNGVDTGLPAKGDTGNTPLLRKNDSLEVIQISYDNGETYESLISYNTLKPIIEAVAVTGAEGTQATVENIGTNVNPIFKFTIPRGRTGLQGPQGNTGASIDYPYELINNLETDDATKGLSAAQGVVLDSKITELGREISAAIDYADSGYIDTLGVKRFNPDCKLTDFIKVSEGDILYVKGFINSTGCIVAGYSSDNEESFESIIAPYGDYTEFTKFTVPSGVNYIRACSAFILGYTEGELAIPSSIWDEIGNIENEIVNIENEIGNIENETTTIKDSSLFTESGYIKTDGTEATSADCKRTDFIPVTEGDVFYYTGWINGGSNTQGACLVGYDSNKDFVSVVLQGFPGFENGYKYQKVTIPTGVSYIRACSAFMTHQGYTWIGYLIRNISDEVSELINTPYENPLNVKFPDLKDKKVVFFGDSITAAGIYESEFQQLSGCIAYNRGVGGTTFAQVNSSLLWNESLADRVDLPAQEGTGSSNRGLPSNPDLIFVFAGINDWGRVAKNGETPVPAGGGSYQPEDYITGNRFGNMNIEDKTTFCGAVRYVFRRLKTKYPNVPIISILPLHTYAPSQYPLWSELNYQNPSNENSNWLIQKTTDDEKTLYDHRLAIKEIANQYGIPVIDTFEMGITPTLATDKSAYYNEGLHPNNVGYHLLGRFIYEQLPKLFLLKSA